MSFKYNLEADDIQSQARALEEFHSHYEKYFRTKTRDESAHAFDYIKGQLLCEGRRNMNKMSIKITDKNEQALSHFISNSPWEEEALIEKIGKDVVEVISTNGKEGGIVLDESGIVKQGKKSVGVARQYCGTLGKVENCQVGVYLAYTNGEEATLIDKRLYLPQEWTDDADRCKEAGVPEGIKFQTKAELGLEMILKAKERGIPINYVGMDAHYGEQPWLLSKFDEEGIQIPYVSDIPSNTRVYVELPKVGIPEKKGKRGRNPDKERVLDAEPVEVRKLKENKEIEWNVLKIRDIERGELWIRFAAKRVYRIEDELPVNKPVWLIIREELDGSDVKFSFSNAAEDTPLEVLARRQSARYWVERALQDAKGLAGLDEYQVIGWRGWHHHMSMILLSMLFLLTLKHKVRDKAPMLTLNDVKEILEEVMPKRKLSLDDAVEIIHKKHLNRYRSRSYRLKKQKHWLANNKIRSWPSFQALLVTIQTSRCQSPDWERNCQTNSVCRVIETEFR